MKTIENAVRFMVELENLLIEHDNWHAAHSLYSLKRDMLRRYGLEEDTTLREHIDELDDNVRLAGQMWDGTQKELREKTGLAHTEESRRHLIQLKTLLNAYADKTGEEFAVHMGAAAKSTETLEDDIKGHITHD